MVQGLKLWIYPWKPFISIYHNFSPRLIHRNILFLGPQAALRVGHPTEALDAAERAIALRGGWPGDQ